MITLTSSDGETFVIEEAAASQSQTIAHMIVDKCTDGGIPIENVTGKILSKVTEYCKKHNVDANGPSDEDLKKWDEDFMQDNSSIIFDLILAANYLSIESLLQLTFQTVADMIKDKNPYQIRSDFNIERGYTTGEEEEVFKKNKWAFE